MNNIDQMTSTNSQPNTVTEEGDASTTIAQHATAFLPAEWAEQSGVQLTWPHAGTDWGYMLEEVTTCFIEIARQIARSERLLVVTPEPARVMQQMYSHVNLGNVRFLKCDTNDTWARDHGAITLCKGSERILLDFKFNAWGNKFKWEKDNAITAYAATNAALNGIYRSCLDFVLEGGSVESDGQGTLLTTSECLLNKNRNPQMSKEEIEAYLKDTLHIERILWLDHGFLEGDDTDSHIDTLARFVGTDHIAYVKCTDEADKHFEELRLMEEQLKTFRTADGNAYKLTALPMVAPVVCDGERLPATYANFLIMNDAVLMPTYNQPENDALAQTTLQKIFPDRKIIGIDCRALIKQHGSLHCVTMQYPTGVIN